MQLPFTVEQFLSVFRAYNEAIWPAQYALVALALIALLLVAFPRRWSSAAVSGILAVLWLWVGIAYHLAFFARINPLAYFFGALSIAGGLVFGWVGIVRRRLEFRLQRNARSVAGASLLAFALAVYPAWAIHAGHNYPELPTFGLPCPVTLFTIGMLGFAVRPYRRVVLVAPLLWCLFGAQAAFLLAMTQDLGLLVAAAFAGFLIATSNRGSVAERLQEV
jgi:hypothetical protein